MTMIRCSITRLLEHVRVPVVSSLVIVVALGGSLSACGGSDDADDLAQSLGADVGENVTIEGTVTQVISDAAFEMETGAVDDPVAVVAATKTTPPSLSAGDDLVVTGSVLEFDRDDIEDPLAIELDDDVVDAFQDRAVLVATLITTQEEPG